MTVIMSAIQVCDRCGKPIKEKQLQSGDQVPEVRREGLMVSKVVVASSGAEPKFESLVQFDDICGPCFEVVDNLLARVRLDEPPKSKSKRKSRSRKPKVPPAAASAGTGKSESAPKGKSPKEESTADTAVAVPAPVKVAPYVEEFDEVKVEAARHEDMKAASEVVESVAESKDSDAASSASASDVVEVSEAAEPTKSSKAKPSKEVKGSSEPDGGSGAGAVAAKDGSKSNGKKISEPSKRRVKTSKPKVGSKPTATEKEKAAEVVPVEEGKSSSPETTEGLEAGWADSPYTPDPETGDVYDPKTGELIHRGSGGPPKLVDVTLADAKGGCSSGGKASYPF